MDLRTEAVKRRDALDMCDRILWEQNRTAYKIRENWQKLGELKNEYNFHVTTRRPDVYPVRSDEEVQQAVRDRVHQLDFSRTVRERPTHVFNSNNLNTKRSE